MTFKIKNARIFKNGLFKADDFAFCCDNLRDDILPDIFLNSKEYVVFPAFCDAHVHFREPGFSYKETIRTGSLAAAHGGYSDVFTMPNLDPVPDNAENLKAQTEIIKKDTVISVHPFAAISKGELGKELSDMEALAPYCIGFSDDGRGVQDKGLMREAMFRASALGKVISAHCEDNSLLNGGYINEGEYAKTHGHKGICSESEWKPIERDIELCADTGCTYHVCHISTAESAELIRQAKKDGINISCETAPHYLTLNDSVLEEDGRFKMNPPLRSKRDMEALREALCDGTIDMIATDHAPHSSQEKSKGLKGSLMGITGLECAFPVLYTELVKKGIITLEKLTELLSINPRKRFSLPMTKDFTVFETDDKFKINTADFLSKGKSTPFEGKTVYGKCVMTVHGGNAVWIKN